MIWVLKRIFLIIVFHILDLFFQYLSRIVLINSQDNHRQVFNFLFKIKSKIKLIERSNLDPMGFASFMWGTAFGMTAIYSLPPKYYNSVKKNLITPTYKELKRDPIIPADVISTVFHGAINSVKDF